MTFARLAVAIPVRTEVRQTVLLDLLTSFGTGLLFAIGLGLSGMTQPARVLGFLDVAGQWDPGLAAVMASAIAVHAPLRWLIGRRARPLIAAKFSLPAKATLDARLFAGAIIFGIGWGLAGICPGPALTSIAGGAAEVEVFVGAMVAGMAAYQVLGLGQERRDA
jgi:uncharacterized membrane protein YedE/YeeE